MSHQQNKIPLFKKVDLDPDGSIGIKLFDYVKSYSPVVRDRNGKIYRFFSKIDYVHLLHSNILTDVFNMVLSCDECNSAKGDLTEKEFLLFIEIHNRHPTSYERLQAYVTRKIISWIRPIL